MQVEAVCGVLRPLLRARPGLKHWQYSNRGSGAGGSGAASGGDADDGSSGGRLMSATVLIGFNPGFGSGAPGQLQSYAPDLQLIAETNLPCTVLVFFDRGGCIRRYCWIPRLIAGIETITRVIQSHASQASLDPSLTNVTMNSVQTLKASSPRRTTILICVVSWRCCGEWSELNGWHGALVLWHDSGCTSRSVVEFPACCPLLGLRFPPVVLC